MTHNAPRTLDLFCGAGGSSYGARNAGCKIVAGVDIWEPAAKMYQANFSSARVYQTDIRKLSPEAVLAEIGPIDLILASPECTSHSRARGNRERSEESRQSAFEVIRFARIFLPDWIVLENVVEMKSWESYGNLVTQLEDLGYAVNDDVILNAKDFGVPQSRQRLFILCSRHTKPKPVRPRGDQVRLASEVISKNTYSFTPLRRPGRARATLERAEQAIKELGPNEKFLVVYYGSGTSGRGGWQRLNEPLRTITTLDRFAYVVPDENGHKMRMLQPEELKLAMGYGPDFKLDEVAGLTRRNRVKLMGNGVCPPVMEAIVKSLVFEE